MSCHHRAWKSPSPCNLYPAPVKVSSKKVAREKIRAAEFPRFSPLPGSLHQNGCLVMAPPGGSKDDRIRSACRRKPCRPETAAGRARIRPPLGMGSHENRRWKVFPLQPSGLLDIRRLVVPRNPFGQFCRHADAPLPSLLPRRGFPRPTPERVLVADHQSGSGFSGIGLSIRPPRPVGR